MKNFTSKLKQVLLWFVLLTYPLMFLVALFAAYILLIISACSVVFPN